MLRLTGIALAALLLVGGYSHASEYSANQVISEDTQIANCWGGRRRGGRHHNYGNGNGYYYRGHHG